MAGTLSVAAAAAGAHAQTPAVPTGPAHGHAPADSSVFAGATAGTDRRPSALGMDGAHVAFGSWSIMVHGFATLSGYWAPEPRGVDAVFSTSMAMAHARRPLGAGWLELQAMVSAEPSSGPSGYPLLLQTGETANGLTPLVDRQHPHDVLMALAASYRVEIDVGVWAFLYAAPVGSPALGPLAFMHRASARPNPVAPISHHFLDATHVAHGVVTAGLHNDLMQLEASWFNGHEPDQDRWTPDPLGLNSYAARLTLTPGERWAIQASYGHLDEPEQLHPVIDVFRTTLSVTYALPFPDGRWVTTAAWGRNLRKRTTMTIPEARARIPAPLLAHYFDLASLPADADESLLLLFPRREQAAYLLESSFAFGGTTAFGRWERALKDELFPPSDLRHSTFYPVTKLDIGIVQELPLAGPLSLGLGASVGIHGVSSELEAAYGTAPRSWMVFARLGT